jgi:threonine/homoserine/homoserine lactone efflux protein
MLTTIASGFLLGLSCGLAPGPLLTLVLTQSLQHGPREGCKIALAPLLTDAPIILVALALATRAAEMEKVLGALSLAGAVFVLYLAVDAFQPVRLEGEALGARPQSWFKGTLTNLLNPHPWLFWMTVGAATLAKAVSTSWLGAVAFLGPFYLLLVGSKVVLALVAGRSRQFVAGRSYRVLLRALGLLLAVFAVLLCREGLKHLTAT